MNVEMPAKCRIQDLLMASSHLLMQVKIEARWTQQSYFNKWPPFTSFIAAARSLADSSFLRRFLDANVSSPRASNIWSRTLKQHWHHTKSSALQQKLWFSDSLLALPEESSRAKAAQVPHQQL
jgi:hypothetical protein